MDPVCFHIGSRPVYWYGVFMAFAFLAGLFHWHWLSRKTGRHGAIGGDLAFWLMLGGLGGARIAYVIANFDYFRAAPGDILRVDQGGLIFYGGFIGAFLAFVGFARGRHVGFLDLADFAVTALPLGHALGRVGCFMNGCCQGSLAPAPSWLTGGQARYPVQLYEAGINLIVYALLTVLYVRSPRRGRGIVLAAYLLTYPIGRFCLEFLRGDARLRWGGFSVAQELSLALVALGAGLWGYARRTQDNIDRAA
jgi:phosphatidylglycerol:prolipoprotein diacylglycerol transferase